MIFIGLGIAAAGFFLGLGVESGLNGFGSRK